MIRYIALKRPAKTKENTYDICACVCEGDLMEILSSAENVSADSDFVRALLATLNTSDVDPIHLEEIIEDTFA